MRQSIVSIALLAIFHSVGCNTHENPQQWKQRFYGHYPHFEKLTKRLQNDARLDTCFQIGPDSGLPNIAASYPSVLKQLQQMGITAASSHPCYRNKWSRWYYFKTNWPSAYPIYIIYDPTEPVTTEEGYYQKDPYKNETWGLGNNWQLFRWVAVVPSVCHGSSDDTTNL
jgi:hypothetical protein